VSRTKWENRDPDYLDPHTGKPIYDRRAKVGIWTAKLKADFFPARKPTHTQRLQIAAAVCLILDLSAAHEGFTSGKPLPKDYLPKLNALKSILASFRPKAPRKTGQAAKDSGLGLAAILGGEA
jgi:hypothetical protein